MTARLELSRDRILAFRRHVGSLDRRLPAGPDSLRHAAWAGLQDSMPRAALLSLHARVEGTQPTALDDPSLAQVWGPRYNAYVVAEQDRAMFTLGRLPDRGRRREVAEDLAARLDAFLSGRRMPYGDAGRGIGEDPNQLRYAALTGTVAIRWQGARQPVIWTVPRPDIDPHEARSELARRHLHVFGPTTASAFATWAGIPARLAAGAFEALEPTLTPVRTPIGDAWILAQDEAAFRAPPADEASARLLPSGDAYTLLHGDDRELLVPHDDQRAALWTPRVWPGAVLVDGEIVGTWRRKQERVTVEPWRRMSRATREAVEVEAASMPLPGTTQEASVHWEP